MAVVGLQELGGLPASSPAADARDAGLLPTLDLVAPTLSFEAVTAVALPLYLVTMAAQNLVGLAVLQTAGYRAPVGTLLVATGAGSALAAPLGAPTVNLAAITGALTAGPDAHPDPARRWTAAATAGAGNLLLGALAPLTAGVVTGSDARLVATAAGLALVPTLAATVAAALGPDHSRTPATVTLVVAASGITGAAPLGLLAGGVLLRLTRRPGPAC